MAEALRTDTPTTSDFEYDDADFSNPEDFDESVDSFLSDVQGAEVPDSERRTVLASHETLDEKRERLQPTDGLVADIEQAEVEARDGADQVEVERPAAEATPDPPAPPSADDRMMQFMERMQTEQQEFQRTLLESLRPQQPEPEAKVEVEPEFDWTPKAASMAWAKSQVPGASEAQLQKMADAHYEATAHDAMDGTWDSAEGKAAIEAKRRAFAEVGRRTQRDVRYDTEMAEIKAELAELKAAPERVASKERAADTFRGWLSGGNEGGDYVATHHPELAKAAREMGADRECAAYIQASDEVLAGGFDVTNRDHQLKFAGAAHRLDGAIKAVLSGDALAAASACLDVGPGFHGVLAKLQARKGPSGATKAPVDQPVDTRGGGRRAKGKPQVDPFDNMSGVEIEVDMDRFMDKYDLGPDAPN